MRKISILTFIFLLICMLICSCGSNESTNTTDNDNEILPMASYIEMTPEEISEQSDCAIIGTYTKMDSYSAYTYYAFDVDKILYGYVPEKTIQEYVLKTSDVKEPYYEEGQQYLLLLKKDECSIYDEYDYYISASALIYFPVDGTPTLYGKEFTTPNGESIEDYFYSLKEKTVMVNVETQKKERTANQRKNYDSLEKEIKGESEFIAYLTIESMESEGIAHTNTYCATVKDMVVGNQEALYYDDDTNKMISIILAKDTVEPGKTYLVGFRDQLNGKESVPIYGQSTLHSVISEKDTGTINNLSNIIK